MTMDCDRDYDLRLTVPAGTSGVRRVMHPCRCDAPDPEAARMEPLDLPLDDLDVTGRALGRCAECDYRVLVVVERPVRGEA
jgi:hypothetical protein